MHPALCVTKETYREQMRQVSTLTHSELCSWLRNNEDTLAAKVQMKILERPQGPVLAELAAQNNLLPSAQRVLIKREIQAVWCALALNPSLTEEVHQKLSEQKRWYSVHVALAGNPKTTIKECRKNLRYVKGDTVTRRLYLGALAGRKDLSEKDYLFFWREGGDSSSVLLSSSVTPQRIIEEVIGGNDTYRLGYLVRNDNLSREQKSRIFAKKNTTISVSLLRKEGLTKENLLWVLGYYSEEEGRDFLKRLLENCRRMDEGATKIIVENLGLKERDKFLELNGSQRRSIITYGCGLPAELVEMAFTSTGGQLLVSLASNVSSSEEVFEKLYSLEDRRVNTQLAYNPNVPLCIREKLSFKRFAIIPRHVLAKGEINGKFAASYVLHAARAGNDGAVALKKEGEKHVRRDFLEAMLPAWVGSWEDFIKAAGLLDES